MSRSERWRDKRLRRRRLPKSVIRIPRRRPRAGVPPQPAMWPVVPPEPPAPAKPPAPPTLLFGTPSDLWLALILAVIAAVSFLPALSSDFVWEDQVLVVNNPALHSPSAIRAIFSQPFMAARPNSYHPLATFTYLTDFLVWRLNPVGYHSTNLTLHLIATLLVYAAAMQVLRRRSMAFAAGAMFAAHPVHVQSVAWVAGRPQLLATCLALFALLSYGSYVTTGTAAPTGAPPRSRAAIYYAASLGAFTLALFAHAAACALLILLPLYEALLYGERVNRTQSAGRRLLPYGGFAAAVVLYLTVRLWALGYHLVVGFDAAQWPAQLATAPLLGVRAFELMLLPLRAQPYIPARLAVSPLRADVLTAAAALVLMVALAARLKVASGGAAFGAWWTLLMLAPTLNWLPLPDPQFGERELYLSSAGIVMPIAWALISVHDLQVPQASLALARKRAWLRAGTFIAFAAAIGLGMFVSWARTQWYRNDITLFTRMARSAPRLAMPHFNLGNAHFAAGDMESAAREYMTAIRRRPSTQAYHNLGNAYMARERYGEAARAYRRALELDPAARESAEALLKALQAQRGEGPPVSP